MILRINNNWPLIFELAMKLIPYLSIVMIVFFYDSNNCIGENRNKQFISAVFRRAYNFSTKIILFTFFSHKFRSITSIYKWWSTIIIFNKKNKKLLTKLFLLCYILHNTRLIYLLYACNVITHNNIMVSTTF